MTSRIQISLPVLLGLLLLTPLVISPGVFSHFIIGKAAYSRTLIEVIGVVWVVSMMSSSRFRPYRSWVLMAFGGYILASTLAAIWGVNTTQSIWSTFDRATGVFDWLHWLLLAMVLASAIRSPSSWWLLLNGMLGITLVLSLIAATQVWGLSLLPGVLAKCRVDATLGNPSYLAPLLVMSILLASGLLTRSLIEPNQRQPGSPEQPAEAGAVPAMPGIFGQRLVWMTFWVAVILLASLVLVYTGTRGALIGLLAGALTMPMALYIWGDRRALRRISLAAGGVALTIGTLLAADSLVGLPTATNCGDTTTTARITSLAETGTSNTSLALRLSAARAGFLAFLDRPILGWGPENFGYAYDQHVDAQIFQHGSLIMDKAHSQVVEEFTTKGLVGGLAFLALWVTLVRAVVRRHRPLREEVLAYAILGAMAAYFVQNLFLFDTPSALLWWVIMVAWAAWQEKEYAPPEATSQKASILWNRGHLTETILRVGTAAFSKQWVRHVTPMLLVALLAVSVYYLNWQPYLAARTFGQSSQPGIPHDERLALAQQSFATFPQMANQTRRLMLLGILRNWRLLDDGEKQRAVAFFAKEGRIASQEDPNDAPMLITSILFIQSTAPSAEVLASVEPMLSRLQRIAPNRAETHQLLANQALLQGRFIEALEIGDRYQAQVPNSDLFFAGIDAAARRGLETGEN